MQTLLVSVATDTWTLHKKLLLKTTVTHLHHFGKNRCEIEANFKIPPVMKLTPGEHVENMQQTHHSLS